MSRVDYLRLVLAIRRQLLRRGRVIVAIDGRCGSGKTTLAAKLQKQLHCSVFHMDVLLPLRSAQAVTYRPFSCARQQLGEPVTTEPSSLTIVEGAYACHPDLWAYYDLRVFLTVDPETQMSRIEARSGPERAQHFRDRWIPFEEKYFKAFDVQARCDMCIHG